MLNLLGLAVSLLVVIKSADYAIEYASRLASAWHLPKYVIGCVMVTLISTLPETLISLNAALSGIPAFGLGMLFGSNVADLTLVLAIAAFATKKGIKVEQNVLRHNRLYPVFVAFPIVFGLDGFYSRLDGVLLILAGAFFHYRTFRRNYKGAEVEKRRGSDYGRNVLGLSLGMLLLLIGAHYTVQYGWALAAAAGISPVLVGMVLVGLGTTLPELCFSVKAMHCGSEGLALGNVLGTVISDATIVVGLVALIDPFAFPQQIVYITAVFMVLASIVLLCFLRTGKILTKRESVLLIIFYLVFVATEYAFRN